MKVQDFLAHHGIVKGNPFSEEDAQTDAVFKEHCLQTTFHPAWDKIVGSAGDPSTSVVFGEKGSGKTALRLQLSKDVEEHNREHPDQRVLTVPYVEFNHSLDLVAASYSGDDSKALNSWRIWDHMDSIFSIGVQSVVDRILKKGDDGLVGISDRDARSMTRAQKRDLLLLCALYDFKAAEPFRVRWTKLRRKLRFSTLGTMGFSLIGILVTLGAIGGAAYFHFFHDFGVADPDGGSTFLDKEWLFTKWPYIAAGVAWVPALMRYSSIWFRAGRARREVRVVIRRPADMRFVFSRFKAGELEDQPIPTKTRPDARYEMLSKFLEVLEVLRFKGILVLVDRVDEPSRINGFPEKMRKFMWPLLDAKLLRYPGVGFKLLLPSQLASFLAREDRAFHDRARLDKLNLVRSLDWSGQALYDLANDRMVACSESGSGAGNADSRSRIRGVFDEALASPDLLRAFEKLRVPRHLFKFLYRVIADHCQAHSADDPKWEISESTFHSTLTSYLRDLQSMDDGIVVG